MVFSVHYLLLSFSLLHLPGRSHSKYPPITLTIVNNCPFTVWPAIQPDLGHPLLEAGGFALPTMSHLSFPAPPTPWSGRIWARTGCTPAGPGRLACTTGDCAGRLECMGVGGTPPATLAQLALHHGGSRDRSSYVVSLVDGFNVGVSATPHGGRGQCPVVGCRENLLDTCPEALRLTAAAPAGGATVVGCRSGCGAFGSDELCCRNKFERAEACRASNYSEFFKAACPATTTYAQDRPAVESECEGMRELKIIFCH